MNALSARAVALFDAIGVARSQLVYGPDGTATVYDRSNQQLENAYAAAALNMEAQVTTAKSQLDVTFSQFQAHLTKTWLSNAHPGCYQRGPWTYFQVITPMTATFVWSNCWITIPVTPMIV